MHFGDEAAMRAKGPQPYQPGATPQEEGRDDPRAESPINYTGIRAWNGPSALGSFS